MKQIQNVLSLRRNATELQENDAQGISQNASAGLQGINQALSLSGLAHMDQTITIPMNDQGSPKNTDLNSSA